MDAARNEGLDEGIKKGKAEGLEEGIQKGLDEGLKKGKTEGIKEGEKKRALAIAKKMLAEVFSMQQVEKISGVSRSDLEKL